MERGLVVIADVRFYRLFAIVWQSGYFQLVNEKFRFLLCKYSRCGKSRLEKAVIGPIEILIVSKRRCLEPFDIVSVN
jgi:hypothetical protein